MPHPWSLTDGGSCGTLVPVGGSGKANSLVAWSTTFRYKLKKSVDMGFLDFSTRCRRLAVCRREVELNRRLAPDVYLGVAEVSDVDSWRANRSW